MFSLSLSDTPGGLETLPLLVKTAGEEKVAAGMGVGVPTLRDIIRELQKPGRDIRDDNAADSGSWAETIARYQQRGQ